MNDNPALYETTPGNFAIKLRSFASKILYFNGLYKLHVAPAPSLKILELQPSRLSDFQKIVVEEAEEIKDIVEMIHTANPADDIDILTNMADLLGDIIVYCYSEAAKYGIPIDEVLHIIMDSNFSKLNTDGTPIYDERGKVMKGPFYWKPEPKIKALLEERIKEHNPS